MNYMAEIAKMLGIKMNEEFQCNDGLGCKYILTEHGLLCDGVPAADCLMMLLEGTLIVDGVLWVPSTGEIYYTVYHTGDVMMEMFGDNEWSKAAYETGNFYRTKEEAERYKKLWITSTEASE